MRTTFHPLSESEFEKLLKTDEVYAYATKGYGLSDISVFSTRKNLRHGDGFISNLITRYGAKLVPMLKKYFVPATKSFAANVAADVMGGESLKTSVKRRGKQGARELVARVVSGRGATSRRPSSRRGVKRKRSQPIRRQPVKKRRKKTVTKRCGKTVRGSTAKKRQPVRLRKTKKRSIINKDIFS